MKSLVSVQAVVLRNGAIVEQGDSHALFTCQQTDYTRELVDAVPHIGVAKQLVPA